MEDYDERPIVIDGYSSVQAIRRSQKRPGGIDASETGETPDGRREPPRSSKAGARIDHTVMPPRHEIACCECDYVFIMAGRITDTMCPKCHRQLKVTDHVIKSEWTEPIRTLGIIDIREDGVINGVELRGRDIILAGNAEKGIIRAGRRLELCKGARFNVAKMKMKDLLIRKGAEFEIQSTISCRNLEVEGFLKTRIFADGIVTIRQGGVLDGELHTPHLVVEDGGGLEAAVVIGVGKGRAATRSTEPEIVVNNQ